VQAQHGAHKNRQMNDGVMQRLEPMGIPTSDPETIGQIVVNSLSRVDTIAKGRFSGLSKDCRRMDDLAELTDLPCPPVDCRFGND